MEVFLAPTWGGICGAVGTGSWEGESCESWGAVSGSLVLSVVVRRLLGIGSAEDSCACRLLYVRRTRLQSGDNVSASRLLTVEEGCSRSLSPYGGLVALDGIHLCIGERDKSNRPLLGARRHARLPTTFFRPSSLADD